MKNEILPGAPEDKRKPRLAEHSEGIPASTAISKKQDGVKSNVAPVVVYEFINGPEAEGAYERIVVCLRGILRRRGLLDERPPGPPTP